MKISVKYNNEIKNIPGCPPTNLQPVNAKLYRFTFDPIRNNDKLPVAKITPDREFKNNRNSVPAKECCKTYALSVFDSLSNLKTKLNSLMKTNPQVQQRLGTHYVCLDLSNADGWISQASSCGHISFYESSKFDFSSAIIKHSEI